MSPHHSDNSPTHHVTYASSCRMCTCIHIQTHIQTDTHTNRKQGLSVGKLMSPDLNPKINNNHMSQVGQVSVSSGTKTLKVLKTSV